MVKKQLKRLDYKYKSTREGMRETTLKAKDGSGNKTGHLLVIRVLDLDVDDIFALRWRSGRGRRRRYF